MFHIFLLVSLNVILGPKKQRIQSRHNNHSQYRGKTKLKIIVTTMAIPTPNFLARKNFRASPVIMKLFAKILIKEVFTSPPPSKFKE